MDWIVFSHFKSDTKQFSSFISRSPRRLEWLQIKPCKLFSIPDAISARWQASHIWGLVWALKTCSSFRNKVTKTCKYYDIVFLETGFRNQMLDALKQFSMSDQNGMFINSCYVHGQTGQGAWFAPDSPAVGNKVSLFFHSNTNTCIHR